MNKQTKPQLKQVKIYLSEEHHKAIREWATVRDIIATTGPLAGQPNVSKAIAVLIEEAR